MFITIIFEKVLLLIDNISQKKNFIYIKTLLGGKINIFFDVGFHKGETSLLANKFFEISEIHAFEPNEECIKFDKKIGFKNVRINNVGVGEKKCIKKFRKNAFSQINSFKSFDEKNKYTKIKKIILKLLFLKNIKNTYRYVKIIELNNYCFKNKINRIDILKIDAEGSELDVLKGLKARISKVRCVLLEHHYDKSLIKNYTFSDINTLLLNNRFKLVCKNKMKFRKIFEYIFINTDYVE